MTAPVPLIIEARTDPAEQAAMMAGAEQLSEHLALASGGQGWPVHVRFNRPGAGVTQDPAAHVIITSMLPETARLDDTMATVEARWRALLERLTASGSVIFICTVFRHVAGRPQDGRASPLLERIRRLNRLAMDLSHDFGVGVIDFDRNLAHVGARSLQTDYRLGGVLASEAAGHAIAWALLSFGLDAAVEPEVQERAKALIGNLQALDRLIRHRLAIHRARETAAKSPAGGPTGG